MDDLYGRQVPLSDGWYLLPGPDAQDGQWKYCENGIYQHYSCFVYVSILKGRLVGATGQSGPISPSSSDLGRDGYRKLLFHWNQSFGGRLYEVLEAKYFPTDDWKDEFIIKL